MATLHTAHSLQVRTLSGLRTLRQEKCCDVKKDTEDGSIWLLCRKPVGHTDHRITHFQLQGNGQYVVQEIYVDPEPEPEKKYERAEETPLSLVLYRRSRSTQ